MIKSPLVAFGVFLTFSVCTTLARDSYEFPANEASSSAHSLRTTIDPAMVRVYLNADAHKLAGTGTVIESNTGIILTAAHVAGPTGPVWVAARDDEDRYEAKIIAYIKPPKITLTNDGSDAPRDIAILKLVDPSKFHSSVEVNLEGAFHSYEYLLAGFGPNTVSPSWGDGIASSISSTECAYTMRDTVFGGDSGGAVIGYDGLLTGVILSGKSSGDSVNLSALFFEPLNCFLDHILDVVEVKVEDQNRIIETLINGDEKKLRETFQPASKTTSQWVSNIILAKTIKIAATKLKNESFRATKARRHLIVNILMERKIGISLALELIETQIAETDRGDELQLLGDKLAGEGNATASTAAYENAIQAYVRQAGTIAGDTSFAKARMLKGASDSASKIASFTQRESDYGRAANLAAASLNYAPDGQLKGSAWAALGSAFQAAGSIEWAVPAYDFAVQEGFNARWVMDSRDLAKEELGAAPQATFDPYFFFEAAKNPTALMTFRDGLG